MDNKVIMVSIDSSTKKTGMACFIDGVFHDHRLIDLSSSKEDTDTRISLMGKNILATLSYWRPSIIYIETPRGDGRNVELVRKLSEVMGIVRAWCIQNDAYYSEVMPTVWRKHCGIVQGGKKRAELKQASVDYVKENYGIDVNDDVADAICIGASMVNRYGDKRE